MAHLQIASDFGASTRMFLDLRLPPTPGELIDPEGTALDMDFLDQQSELVLDGQQAGSDRDHSASKVSRTHNDTPRIMLAQLSERNRATGDDLEPDERGRRGAPVRTATRPPLSERASPDFSQR